MIFDIGSIEWGPDIFSIKQSRQSTSQTMACCRSNLSCGEDTDHAVTNDYDDFDIFPRRQFYFFISW